MRAVRTGALAVNPGGAVGHQSAVRRVGGGGAQAEEDEQQARRSRGGGAIYGAS